MSVLVKLRGYKNIPTSENEVRKYILKNGNKVLRTSVQELANESFSSPASVVRLCKRIGLSGFSEMKLMLASELKAYENMELKIIDSTTFKKGDSVKDIVNKVTDISISSIEETRLLIDEEKLLKVARKIMESNIIDLYGAGASNNVAYDIAYKFMRIGKNICCLSLVDRQRIQAINSDPSHFGIIISYSGETKEMLEIAEILRKNGVPTVSITSSIKNSLMDIVDDNLFVSSRESTFRNGAIISRTSTLYMLDLLYVTCLSLSYDHSNEQLKKTLTISK